MATDPWTSPAATADAGDQLMEVSGSRLRQVLDARFDRLAALLGADPRDAIGRQEILARFDEEYPLSEEGVYYLLPDTLDSFCARIAVLAGRLG